ncbi:c-type cytochrome [Roseivivax isoporae]|uniref:Gluconate 2-dehydrogenase n=1 Tax=Roseivivax isoporae LMG 25204 TaxID=1449351 RepID=X7FE47_9RHOB|nr:cytochrome c [Roseivivax isoporae]ETX30361.1 gluconate 2-dehydrogenase [Roseivivax isoporae LMG 25204]
MKRLALILAGAAAAVLAVLAVVYLAFTGPGDIPPATVDFDALGDEEHADLVARGRYVARAADCVACHKSEDGLALAGGLPLETPFGTLYGTNVTPSDDHGIGDWSADDLYRAMVWGINPDGSRLYPAMPYASYHHVARADVDALWLYLMAERPVDKPNRPAELTFPFNIRPAIAFWNLLYRPDDPGLAEVAGKSESWHRGRYLVDVLGHCGECHTPRNLAYARTDAHLEGEVIEGALSPDISPEGLVRRGWTPEDLARFMREGLSPQGTMTFRMYPVLEHSSRYLTDADMTAMVTYLFDGAPGDGQRDPALAADAPPRQEADLPPEGRRLYVGLCAGCHGTEGEGHPHASVPLDTNTTAMLDDPLNLVRIIREGVPARTLAGEERMQAMPGFADRLDAAEMAALANYMRVRWGGRPGDVTPEQVEDIAEAHGG